MGPCIINNGVDFLPSSTSIYDLAPGKTRSRMETIADSRHVIRNSHGSGKYSFLENMEIYLYNLILHPNAKL
jgi:hypothetical protein